jgi:hypothetical protein
MFSSIRNFLNLPTSTVQPSGDFPQNQPERRGQAPPASQRVLSNLPLVKITADDILEVTNKECLICLDEQRIGEWGCKLQCGHLFHKRCLTEWLEKHCTCPVCRYELETDDATYESDRIKRMKSRKLRLRKDEIASKSIGQLRAISTALNVNIDGCLDKTEVIDKLIKSGKIEVTEGLPPIQITEEELVAKSVKELKVLLLSFGISDKDALYKSELRSKLLSSGRVVLVPSAAGANSSNEMKLESSSRYCDIPVQDGTARWGVIDEQEDQEHQGGRRGQGSVSGEKDEAAFYLHELQALHVHQLKALCDKYGVDVSDCCGGVGGGSTAGASGTSTSAGAEDADGGEGWDREELLQRLLESGHVSLLFPSDNAFQPSGSSGGGDDGSRGRCRGQEGLNHSPSPPEDESYCMVDSDTSTGTGGREEQEGGPPRGVEGSDEIAGKDSALFARSVSYALFALCAPPFCVSFMLNTLLILYLVKIVKRKKSATGADGFITVERGGEGESDAAVVTGKEGGQEIESQQSKRKSPEQHMGGEEGCTGGGGAMDIAVDAVIDADVAAFVAASCADVTGNTGAGGNAPEQAPYSTSYSSCSSSSYSGDIGTSSSSSISNSNTHFSTNHDNTNNTIPRAPSPRNTSSTTTSTSTSTSTTPPVPTSPSVPDALDSTMLTLSAELLRDMSVGEVKSVMQAYGLGWAGCLEKADLIARLRTCPALRIL